MVESRVERSRSPRKEPAGLALRPFVLERFFAKYEFSVPHQLCNSDCEAVPMSELLKMASETEQKLWDDLSLGYTESAGMPELREAIVSLYNSEEGPKLSPCHVISSLAPEEGIYLAFRAMLAASPRNARVIATWPGYQSLTEICHSAGAEIVRWQARESPTGFHFDVSELEKMLRAAPTHIVVVNFPHNPTGALPTKEEWARIVSLVDEAGAILFSDEMYHMLAEDAERLPSAVVLSQRAMTLCGLSKAWGMPGLRMGWLVSRNADLLSSVAQYRDYVSICGPAPCEILALIALRNTAKITASLREIIQTNKIAYKRLIEAAEKKAGAVQFKLLPSIGGPTGLLRISGAEATAYCEKLADESKVLLLPSSCFEFGEDYVRIGFGRRNCIENLKVWARTLGVEDDWSK